MEFLTIFGIVASITLSGCMQSSSNVQYEEVSNGIVCGQLSGGEKQTFPSLNELTKVGDAQYLHDGPCYEK